MKTKHKTICTRVYNCCAKVDGEVKILETKTFTFTQLSSMMVRNTQAKDLIPSLDLIAKYHNLNLENFAEFELALDAVKHCVTWN
jgi:hypothetical protein